MTDRRTQIEGVLRHLAPRIPGHELGAVVDHAVHRKSLRDEAPDTAAWLSLVAYVRHAHTDYDELLASGYDVESARHVVLSEMQNVLDSWGVRRKVLGD